MAELEEFETCHSKTPPDTEGVNADEIVVKSTVVNGQILFTGDVTEGVLGCGLMTIFISCTGRHDAPWSGSNMAYT
jgi:hypothetical protein